MVQIKIHKELESANQNKRPGHEEPRTRDRTFVFIFKKFFQLIHRVTPLNTAPRSKFWFHQRAV